jgi:hypothetical protein
MVINFCNSESINWEAISAIGQVAGAIATFIAVYVAMFQIRKTTEPQIKVEVLKALLISNIGDVSEEHYNFKIINTGIVAANVSNMYIILPDKRNLFFFEQKPFLLNPMDKNDFFYSTSLLKIKMRENGCIGLCNVKIVYELSSGQKSTYNLTIDLNN